MYSAAEPCAPSFRQRNNRLGKGHLRVFARGRETPTGFRHGGGKKGRGPNRAKNAAIRPNESLWKMRAYLAPLLTFCF